MYLIVIAEDNPGDLFLLKEALQTYSIQCKLIPVENGPDFNSYVSEICEKEERDKPDLIILDWTLPKANVRELLEIVRKSNGCAESPILILTSSTSPENRKIAFEAGATCFINKPTGLDEFMDIGRITKELLEGGPHLNQVERYSCMDEI